MNTTVPAGRCIKPGLELNTPLFLLTTVVQLMEGLATQMVYQSSETPEMALEANLTHVPGPSTALFRLELVWDEGEQTERREVTFVVGNQTDLTRMDSHITYRTTPAGEQPQLEMEVVGFEIASRSLRSEIARTLAEAFFRFLNTGDRALLQQLKTDLQGLQVLFKDLRD